MLGRYRGPLIPSLSRYGSMDWSNALRNADTARATTPHATPPPTPHLGLAA